MNKVNPLQLIQLIKNGKNPQQLLMNIMQQQGGNPILQNAMGMMKKGNASGLQMLARNLAAQRGINFDQAFAEFQSYFK